MGTVLGAWVLKQMRDAEIRALVNMPEEKLKSLWDRYDGCNAVVDKVLVYRSSRKNKKTKKAAEKAKPKNPNRKKP